MKVFGNVAAQHELKRSKSTGRDFWEFRRAKSQRGLKNQPTCCSVRLINPENAMLDKGDFLKFTGPVQELASRLGIELPEAEQLVGAEAMELTGSRGK